ncbi:MAG: GNAT family N-acetyltransferase [Planctomycetota bacterium]
MTTISSNDRITLRVPTPADVAPLAELWSDPETMQYIGAGEPWDEAKVRERIERAIVNQHSAGMCFWTVTDPAGVVMGQGGLVPIEFNGPEVELGYRLGRSFWGKGYATEIARLSRDHAFGPLGLDRLVAVTYPENQASRRVLAKVGFRETGMSDVYYGVRCLAHELTRDMLGVDG